MGVDVVEKNVYLTKDASAADKNAVPMEAIIAGPMATTRITE